MADTPEDVDALLAQLTPNSLKAQRPPEPEPIPGGDDTPGTDRPDKPDLPEEDEEEIAEEELEEDPDEDPDDEDVEEDRRRKSWEERPADPPGSATAEPVDVDKLPDFVTKPPKALDGEILPKHIHYESRIRILDAYQYPGFLKGAPEWVDGTGLAGANGIPCVRSSPARRFASPMATASSLPAPATMWSVRKSA